MASTLVHLQEEIRRLLKGQLVFKFQLFLAIVFNLLIITVLSSIVEVYIIINSKLICLQKYLRIRFITYIFNGIPPYLISLGRNIGH